MRFVVISDTHGPHNRIDDLPDGAVLVHTGDFMNSGFDVQDILNTCTTINRITIDTP